MHGFFLVLFAVLQATLVNYIEIFSIKPNLFLVYVVIICCFCDRIEGGAVGFAFGFAFDLLTGKIWGLYSLLGLICGFFISHFCRKVLRNNNLIIVFIFVFIGTIIFETIYYIISLIYIESYSFLTAFFRIILPESFYNVLVSLPVYLLISRFAKRLYVDKGEIIG